MDGLEDSSVDWEDEQELASWSAFDDGDNGRQEPPGKAPKLSSKAFSLDFSSHGSHQKNNSDHFDIVISGLGWISVRASNSGIRGGLPSTRPVATVTVSAPLGTLKLLRTPPLLPFEEGHRGGKRGDGQHQAVSRPKHFSKKRVWTPVHQRVPKTKRGY